MKKLMTIAAMAALILAAGCAEIENKSATNDAQHAIGFSNYAPKSLTKAGDTYAASTTLINGKKFGVYSYATKNEIAFATSSAAALGTQFMNGVEVTYTTGGDSDATKNTYSPMRYWPSGDTPDWLTFWAYYPVQSGNGITYTAPGGDNGLGSYAFTAAASAANMVDFMVSNVVNDKIYGTTAGDHIAVNGVVPLVFNHQLTKVQFKFKTTSLVDASTTVNLLEAKLYNVKTTGTLTTAYNASATPNITTTWGSQGTPSTYDVTFTNGSNTINPEIGDNTTWITLGTTALPEAVGTENPAADIFLMVPQDMVSKTDATNAQYLEVTWEVTTGTGTSAVTTRNSQKLYFYNDLKNGDDPTDANYAAAGINWVKNNFVTYIITIGPKPIQFTATVEDWGAAYSGYFNVQ